MSVDGDQQPEREAAASPDNGSSDDDEANTEKLSAPAEEEPPPPQPEIPPEEQGPRPRFGIGGPPPSPYTWVDGKRLRSALNWEKKQPQRKVRFPWDENKLITGYLEPVNPWEQGDIHGFFFFLGINDIILF